MIQRFIELYAAFGYNGVDVEDLLNNPLNTIAYVEDEEGVVSTALAERALIEVNGFRPLRIAEITEAVTRVKDRGRGLYRAISGYLVDSLVEDQEKPLNIIYGESNLAMKGVLISAHHNGRRFSYFDAGSLGLKHPHFGILQQNFHVEDGTEKRPYNDFALSYVPIK